MAKSVVFFDTEIGVDDKKIHDIGAVRSDKGTLHTASVSDFCAFSADADFLCGHNVVRHDMKYLAPVVDGRVSLPIVPSSGRAFFLTSKGTVTVVMPIS